MPELPEVETVRGTLKNFILGKEIAEVKIYYDKIITGDPFDFAGRLKGQCICDIERIGKYLIFILSEDAFISHLRMEGKYTLVSAYAKIQKHEHVVIDFTDGTSLRYADTRKFGRIEIVSKDHYMTAPALAKLGPEPWQAEAEEVYRKLQRSSLPIKTILLDQSVLAGIGNIYANEICFKMKLHPKTPAKNLSKKRVAELIEVSGEILDRAIKEGGTTIHSFDANGITGLFQNSLLVHMQKVCDVCGGEITKEAVHGRGTYYCKNCQKRRS